MRAKLVRDNCESAWTTPLSPGQTMQPANSLAGKHMALLLKLHEEANEIADDATNPFEYADLLETLLELSAINGVPWDLIESALLEKRKERGGFRLAMIYTCDVPKRESWSIEPITVRDMPMKPMTGVFPHPCSAEGRRLKLAENERLSPRK